MLLLEEKEVIIWNLIIFVLYSSRSTLDFLLSYEMKQITKLNKKDDWK